MPRPTDRDIDEARANLGAVICVMLPSDDILICSRAMAAYQLLGGNLAEHHVQHVEAAVRSMALVGESRRE